VPFSIVPFVLMPILSFYIFSPFKHPQEIKITLGKIKISFLFVASCLLIGVTLYSLSVHKNFKDQFPPINPYFKSVGDFIKNNTGYNDIVFSPYYEIPTMPAQSLAYSQKLIYRANSIFDIYDKVRDLKEDFFINIFLLEKNINDTTGNGNRYVLAFVNRDPTTGITHIGNDASAIVENFSRIGKTDKKAHRPLDSDPFAPRHTFFDVRAAELPERAIDELRAAGFIYEAEGALWFRSTALGDDKDRVLRKSDGELTYFAVDIGFHHFGKFADVDCVIDLLGPDHHGYIPRLKAAMTALGHPEAAFDVLIVQLVTLLRDGQPVPMSKRRGEFVLMEELLEEVGRDAARFTFLTRRHDSPLEFDLAVATRQSADNPVFYVQYAHARVTSLFRTAAQQGVAVPPWREVDFGRLALPEEQTIIKGLLQYPELVAGAARAREPHRIAYYLSELAGIFHPYYKAHRILTEDRPLSLARLGLCAAVGQVLRSGLGLLGVSAPESM